MTLRSSACLLVVAVVCAGAATGAPVEVPRHATLGPPDGYARLLIPVTAVEINGANGSVWTTEFRIFNGGDTNLFLIGPFPFISLSPFVQDNQVAARETRRLSLEPNAPGFDGAFVFMPAELADGLSMVLRARDISRNAQSYGTSIPIVTESEFKNTIRLIDVPTDSAYRVTMRIYGATPIRHSVLVSVFIPGRVQPIDEYVVNLGESHVSGLDADFMRPAYAQIDPLSNAVRAAGPAIRIEISNFSDIVSPPPPPIWAFVSISNNVTQQVTVISP